MPKKPKKTYNEEQENEALEPKPKENTTPSAPASAQYGYDPFFLNNPGYTGDVENSPGPEPPRDSPEWPAWKAHAKAWRRSVGERQAYVDMMLGMGASLEDLGIRPVKEEGLAGYNRIMNRMSQMGNLNRGYEYDFASGRKRNVITSDVTARDRWEPISPEEMAEYKYNLQFGGRPGSYIDRLRSEQQGRFASVMGEGGAENGIQKTSWGGYADPRPDGSIHYYDTFGARTDDKGNRIGGSYHHDGKGQIVVNRVSSSTGEEGHASSNGIANAPTFAPLGGATYGAWTAAPTTPTPKPPVAGKPASPPVSISRDYRGMLGEDLGNYGGWGQTFGVNYTPIQRYRRQNPSLNPYLQGMR